jgi:hypothetical protein
VVAAGRFPVLEELELLLEIVGLFIGALFWEEALFAVLGLLVVILVWGLAGTAGGLSFEYPVLPVFVNPPLLDLSSLAGGT